MHDLPIVPRIGLRIHVPIRADYFDVIEITEAFVAIKWSNSMTEETVPQSDWIEAMLELKREGATCEEITTKKHFAIVGRLRENSPCFYIGKTQFISAQQAHAEFDDHLMKISSSEVVGTAKARLRSVIEAIFVSESPIKLVEP